MPEIAEVETHTPTLCEECLQVDDHPKVHYGPRTMHHDCTPPSIRRDIEQGVHSVSQKHTMAGFDGTDKGLKGGELRAHIRRVHRDAEKVMKANADAEAKLIAEHAASQLPDGSYVVEPKGE